MINTQYVVFVKIKNKLIMNFIVFWTNCCVIYYHVIPINYAYIWTAKNRKKKVNRLSKV